MVIIITGASHVGKTILAQRMLEKYKYPYFSIDHLKMGLIRSGITDLTPEDDDELTDYLWPIVREIIKTAIENEQNLIVEGCYIPFDWRNSFESYRVKLLNQLLNLRVLFKTKIACFITFTCWYSLYHGQIGRVKINIIQFFVRIEFFTICRMRLRENQLVTNHIR